MFKLTLTGSAAAAALAVAMVLWAAPGQAQDWPKAKPITFTVAFAPGSSTDIVARTVGHKLSESLGQTVVVENKPGAGGNIGAQLIKRAAPDGYSILVVSVAFAVNPSLYASAAGMTRWRTSRPSRWARARPTSSPCIRRCRSTTSRS